MRPPRPLQNPRGHGEQFRLELQRAVLDSRAQVAGADDRVLLTFEFADEASAQEFSSLRGFDLVSQEGKRVVLAFVDEDALAKFEARLASLARGADITRKTLIYALESIHAWSPAQRIGRALRLEGSPESATFVVDVELWPVDSAPARNASADSFRNAIRERGIVPQDAVLGRNAVVFRVAVNREGLEWLLNYRDVRAVDLPPRWELTQSDAEAYFAALKPITPVDGSAPAVAVLDTGVVGGHPLIAPALGDAQSFYSARPTPADDDHGHGTFVAALAAFGDISSRVVFGLSCDVVLLSGRVLDANAEYIASVAVDGRYDSSIISKDVTSAVQTFVTQYGCRVFCLSFGDRRKPYVAGHLTGLAVTLDELSREFQVLFVVAAGNIRLQDLPRSVRDDYPWYINGEACKVIDPGTALNALTVGAVARREADDYQQQHEDDPGHMAIARRGEPSPITRSGPTVAGAIKPDVVYYGGNVAIDMRTGSLRTRGLGEVSARHDFVASGRLFREDLGTSFAAPVVAHHAARLVGGLPSGSPMLARAVIGAHARVTPQLRTGLNDARLRRNIVGYGFIGLDDLHDSTQSILTLTAEEAIANKRHHFYELPIDPEFFTGIRRTRSLSVALSYWPSVRTTRVDYKETRVQFRLVEGDLAQVTRMFNAATSEEEYENIPEFHATGFLGARARSRGSLQCSTWSFTRARAAASLIVVVTRNDQSWASQLDPESYAMAIVLDDRANAEAQLHSYAIQRLRGRLRQQVRGA
jgi:hypothetical protein